jgi:sugar phosphate isomerase/epimerase
VKTYLQSYSLLHHYAHAPGFDVFAVLERAAAAGYDGVSINVNGPGYRQLSGTSAAHVERVRARLDALGLGCDLETSGTSPEHLDTLTALCARLGAPRLRTYLRHAGSVAEQIAATTADLRAAAERCAARGVTVLLENHEDLTGAEAAEIVADVDHPAVAALFDYGNSMMVGEEPLAALVPLLPHVRSAHLKDHACVTGGDGEPWVLGVPIGSGALPVADLTRRLAGSPCEVVIVSNVFAYRAPVRSWRGGARPGEGVFRAELPPFDPLLRPWDEQPPARLVEHEARALELGEAWLRGSGLAPGLRA